MVAPVQEEADAAGMPRLAFTRKGRDHLQNPEPRQDRLIREIGGLRNLREIPAYIALRP
jgi:hypothetical protein